ncbi:hypothetical protein ACH5RR_015090 [Cinchona calisaya]|uniref:Uncharacterized protein n=1 Tax=Cinchona calisaya TaxID=153742 RepID=A0ABD2ZS51_9GENT
MIQDLCLIKRTLWSARHFVEQLEDFPAEEYLFERCSPLFEILRIFNFLMILEETEFCTNCKFSVFLDRASEDLELIRSEWKRNMENLELVLIQIATRIFQPGGIGKPLFSKSRPRMCVVVSASHSHYFQIV